MAKGKSKSNIESQLGIFPTLAVVVDSNLFILLLVGLFDTLEIDRFDKSKGYGENQFNFLLKVLGSYKKIIVTQPILTEATNHLDKLNKRHHSLFYQQVLTNLLKFEDRPTSTIDILNGSAFASLGFADSSLEILSRQYVILTDDEPLSGHIRSKSGKVVYWKELNPQNY